MDWRGFGFVHHSRSIFCRAVPNPSLTIRNFFVAVPGRAWLEAAKGGALGTLAAMLRANGSLLTYTQQVRRGRLQLCGAPIHIDCLSHSRKTKRVVVASMLFAAHHG